MAFVHLHTRTEYSLGRSIVRVSELANRVMELRMPAVAVTDLDTMSALPMLQDACSLLAETDGHAPRPIFGCEVGIVDAGTDDEIPDDGAGGITDDIPDNGAGGITDGAADKPSYRLTLLVEDGIGYRNLCELSSAAMGGLGDTRCTDALLARRTQGLIGLGGICEGNGGAELAAGDIGGFVSIFTSWVIHTASLFAPGSFFIELRDAYEGSWADEADIRGAKLDAILTEIATRQGIATVATGNSLFLDRGAEGAYLLAAGVIGTEASSGGHGADARATAGGSGDASDGGALAQCYVKSEQEMRERFAHCPEACDNTVRIAKRCRFEFDEACGYRPALGLRDMRSPEEYLFDECRRGMRARYGNPVPGYVQTRFEREFDIVRRKELAPHLVLLMELASWARTGGAASGDERTGRTRRDDERADCATSSGVRRDDDDTVRHLVLCWGSAPDSILCYALGLTDIDPIANGLIGERFIDPESGDMPELTLALDRSGVDALDRHLSKIHDGENVVRVGAFDHIRLVPLIDVDWGPLAYCTMPSWRESILFARAGCDVRSHADGPSGLLDTDTPEALAELLCQTDVDYGARLICDRPAHRIVPLRFDEAARKTVTQYQADVRLGLGVPINLVEHPLLTAIAATMARIDDRHGEVTEADFDAAPLDDPSIFESLSHDGAEQFFWNLLDIEPRGADAALARFAPANIRELAALLSVLATGRFRPGMTDELLARKTSWSATDEMLRGTDEAVVEILDDSFGLVIYQEQIMRLAMEMCDFTATEANLLRKLAGMHRDDLIRTEKRVWADGRADTIEHRWARQAVRRGHTVVETIRLWDMVLECAPIAYCKAHALTYAELMVRTAWLKAHYPDEYAECFVR